ncbi:hypothetical protein [Gimesia chilikensis]|uniref:DUF4145 domain-containing protein n=1 Tax=Gimesia chilikensis TaxID=2605989 RepID=A0A517PWW3_9PLAN|nr:hypothetical protein [Gimesia chilikensis]QDT23876.1 hypothetical protein HG66A1_57010 [Gimesia chilikensis]
MLPEDALKDLLSQDLRDRDKALICLATDPVGPREIKDVTALAFGAGWRQVKRKNLSAIFKATDGLAVRATKGWELTSAGSQYVAKLAGPLLNSPIPIVASSLRSHLVKITDPDTQTFAEEAIVCFEARQFRAAIVLSWVGAVSVLHHHIINNRLADFNAEATKRNSKWKNAKTVDDLGIMKEDTFLDILQALSVLGKNVKQELKKALTLRNGCGHPNSLKVAEHKASAHIEDLIINVFAIF